MRAVGIRDLKNRLSEYLRMVRAGERLLVTDRGEVVAELTQPRETVAEVERHPELARMIREGRVSRATENRPEIYPVLDPLLGGGRALELLDQERGRR